MNERTLVVVNRNEDVDGVVKLIKSIFAWKDFSKIRTAKTTTIDMKSGVRIDIWSVENWYDGITCGANFDHVCYLTQIPKFVRRALEPCLIHEEKAMEGSQ